MYLCIFLIISTFEVHQSTFMILLFKFLKLSVWQLQLFLWLHSHRPLAGAANRKCASATNPWSPHRTQPGPSAAMALMSRLPDLRAGSPVPQLEHGRAVPCPRQHEEQQRAQPENSLSPLRALTVSPTRLTFFTFMPRPDYLLPPHRFIEEFSLVSDATYQFHKSPCIFSGIWGFIWERIQETVLVHPLVYPYKFFSSFIFFFLRTFLKKFWYP